MLVKECKMPDISDLESNVVGCFLAASLAGELQKRPKQIKSSITVLARLIDKARTEYLIAREAVIEEEKEGKLSYEEIMKRGQGQFLYTCEIINHLENCINALSRIYKLFKLIPEECGIRADKDIRDLRNSIEHIDERITSSAPGSLSLNISEDALSVEIAGKRNKIHVKLESLASQIRYLNSKIRDLIDDNCQ